MRGIVFEDKTPEELIDLRKPFVMETRNDYRTFWERTFAERQERRN